MNKIKSFCKFNLFLNIKNYSIKYKKYQIYSLYILSKQYFDVIKILKLNKQILDIVYFDKNNNLIKLENCLIKKTILFLENYYKLKILNWKIIVNKNIPLGSGLGGGSSNAASIINWFYKQYKIDKSHQISYFDIAINLGSDIPFFLSMSKAAFVSNFGDVIKPFNSLTIDHNIIINDVFCNTKEVFKKYKYHLKKIKNKIHYQNDLMPIVFELYPELINVYKKLLKKNKNIVMSGSGSSFVIIK